MSILLYADDVMLIAPNAESLQLMLNKLHEWCSKWRLSVNSDKTKIVHFRPSSVLRCNNLISCGNLNIELTDKYKYLGLWFQEHLDLKFATSELAKSASRALSVLYAKFKCAGDMAYDVYTKLYTFACRTKNILLFGYLGFDRLQQIKYCAKHSLQILFSGEEKCCKFSY